MLVVAVLLATTLGARVLTGGGLSAPVVAGDAYVTGDAGERPADLAIVNDGSTGYDGQFVYRLALDPFTRERTAYGITLDNPPYRQQRVGLPLAAHALHRAGVPVSAGLLLVNVAGVLLAAWAGAVLAHRLGRHRLWGALLALSPGVVVAANRDLTEPLQIGLLLAGLVAWTGGARSEAGGGQREVGGTPRKADGAPREADGASRDAGRAAPWRLAGAVGAFTAAAFTRETTLVVLFGLGAWEAYRALRGPDRHDRRTALLRATVLAIPVLAIAAWQLHLAAVWGDLPSRATDDSLGLPFVRTVRTFLAGGGDWHAWTSKEALQAHSWVAERLVLAALLAVTAVSLRRSTAPNGVKAAWVAAALLALSTQWTRDVAFLRAANEALVLATLVLLATKTKTANAALATTAGLSLFVAGVYGVVV